MNLSADLNSFLYLCNGRHFRLNRVPPVTLMFRLHLDRDECFLFPLAAISWAHRPPFLWSCGKGGIQVASSEKKIFFPYYTIQTILTDIKGKNLLLFPPYSQSPLQCPCFNSLHIVFKLSIYRLTWGHGFLKGRAFLHFFFLKKK